MLNQYYQIEIEHIGKSPVRNANKYIDITIAENALKYWKNYFPSSIIKLICFTEEIIKTL